MGQKVGGVDGLTVFQNLFFASARATASLLTGS